MQSMVEPSCLMPGGSNFLPIQPDSCCEWDSLVLCDSWDPGVWQVVPGNREVQSRSPMKPHRLTKSLVNYLSDSAFLMRTEECLAC